MNINRKSEEMWKKGKVMLQDMEQKQRQMTAQFAEGVTKVQDKQRALEAENAWLKHTLTDLNDKFSMLGAVLASDPVPSCAGTPPRSHSSPEIHRCGKMPDVPAFPFPLPPALVPAAAPPLSLVSALGVPPPPEALVRQKTPLSLMETLAPPSAFPLTPPAHPAVDGGSFGYPEGIESPSSESPIAWGQAQADQAGRVPRDSQTEEEWDEQQLLDLAMLHGGCPSLHSSPEYSLNGGGWFGFALRADASVFVPSVSVGAA